MTAKIITFIIVTFAINVFVASSFAQGVCNVKTFRVEKIRGKVVSQGTTVDDPVAQAKIELRLNDEDETLVTSTNADNNGLFEFSHIKPGTYWLIVSKELFLKYPVKVNVVRNRRKTKKEGLIAVKLGAYPLEPCGGGDVTLATK